MDMLPDRANDGIPIHFMGTGMCITRMCNIKQE